MKLLGLIAAILTTSSFAPQAIKTIRTKSTESISLGMYIMFNLGVLCWLCYGVYLNDLPLILANSVTIVLTGTILYLKLKHG